MSTGTLEFTLISAAISPHAGFDTEPTDTYAILRCIKEQRCTKTARDQGRLPTWNETFTFNLQEQDMSKDVLMQVFGVKTEVDELLGLARIPILTMIGKEEATLCALINPSKGETGKLKAAWRWKPNSERSLKATNFEGKVSGVQEYTGSESYTAASFDPNVPYVGDRGPVAYPNVHVKSRDPEPYGNLDAVSNAMAKLTVDKGSSGRSTPSAPPYLEDSIRSGGDVKGQGGEYYPYSNSAVFGAYPTEHTPISEPPVYSGYPDIRASSERKEEFGAYSSPVLYSRGPSEYSYPPPPADKLPTFPPYKDTYPPYSGYQSSTSEFSHDKGTTYPPYPDYHNSSSLYKQVEALPYTERGVGGDTKEKGEVYGCHAPYGQPPSAGSPPSSYPPPPPGYPPSSCPPPYGHPPDATLGYPPAPQGYPPALQGYPPAPQAHTERGIGGDTKTKGHGSHATYGPPPPLGYPPSSYPPPPPGYRPSSYPPPPPGYRPSSYPPPYGHPPEAAHGYPPAPYGYPPATHGYPPVVDHHSVTAYPPYGYPPSAPGSHQAPYPVDHRHGSGYPAAGAYVGHSSSSSKPSKKKQKEPKDSSSHGHHNKHKKQKSFKGLKFKKFKKFKF